MSAVPTRQLREERSPTEKWFGARLKLRRRLVGLTQDQLAKEAGLSPQQIHKYETGQSKMTAARLVQFSDLLEVNVLWFFDGIAESLDVADTCAAEPVTEDEFRLLEHFRNIADPERRVKLIEITKLLADTA